MKMTRDEAVERARECAQSEGFRIGEVLSARSVSRDEVRVDLQELDIPYDALGASWVVRFKLPADPRCPFKFHPYDDDCLVWVDDETAKAEIVRQL